MLGQTAEKLMQFAQVAPYIVLPLGFVVFAYVIITLDRRRDNSPSKDDTQVGIKLVLWALTLAGIQIATGGVGMLLSYILGGFKGGAAPIKVALPSILVGGAAAFAMLQMMLPRTNTKTAPQIERYAIGLLGASYGAMAIADASVFLTDLFNSAPWGFMTAPAMSSLLVDGAIGFLALNRLGALSGWTTPVRPAAPMSPPGYPQGGGYPPQQGGGYPPQQGGGYPPPQGGGYPPQGGGYPPPQGGGYPPR